GTMALRACWRIHARRSSPSPRDAAQIPRPATMLPEVRRFSKRKTTIRLPAANELIIEADLSQGSRGCESRGVDAERTLKRDLHRVRATLVGLVAFGCAVLSAAAALAHAPSPGQFPRLRPPDVRFVPTPQNVVEAMLAMAHVAPTDVVYDLGSGDGRIPITAAKNYGARAV